MTNQWKNLPGVGVRLHGTGRLHPKDAWADVYLKRVFHGHPEHMKRFAKADRAKRLVLFWIRGVTS